MKPVKIGLIGFGTIGAGVVRILQKNRQNIVDRLGTAVEVACIADLDITTPRGVEVDQKILTTNAYDVVNHPDVDVVVELIGGYEPARDLILKAFEHGKHVVTANKALLAKHGDELFAAAEKHKVNLGFEAAVGGAIPIIRSIREAFVANRIEAIEGIVNGTANYILSKMSDEDLEFELVLKEAQEKGFAEADPTFDVEGIDSAHKIAILSRLSFGTSVDFEKIYIQGISRITPVDIKCAREFGFRIKLLAVAKFDGKELDIRVHPAMIPESKPMANVNGVLNAIMVRDDLMEENVLVGHGAGSLPTGSAVVGDIVEIARNILSGASGRVPAQSFQSHSLKKIPLKPTHEIEGEYFLRFLVQDKPGVLSKISGILGRHDISIESMIQRGRDMDGKGVPLVMMTHQAKEKNIQQALKEIEQLDVVCEKTVLIRVER
ncbi:homoserine dehydrogenase [Nitrospina gracilis]|uniref:homoserine dehydrogenase n=1 Tax=Nitrospina gracilis TaxID=35801 RepID=UPI001F2279C4|nr:homoserine dehydrogenase [Nitrospina gracilis]MCF8720760.1 homoserine dehydrogenase [Nitrospina gracilis Nb-211]